MPNGKDSTKKYSTIPLYKNNKDSDNVMRDDIMDTSNINSVNRFNRIRNISPIHKNNVSKMTSKKRGS